MTGSRRPHAIHNLRSMVAKAHKRAEAAMARCAEAHCLLQASIEGGGVYHLEAAASEALNEMIADLQYIAHNTAVIELEPGHTQRRTRQTDPRQPALLAEAPAPKRARSR